MWPVWLWRTSLVIYKCINLKLCVVNLFRAREEHLGPGRRNYLLCTWGGKGSISGRFEVLFTDGICPFSSLNPLWQSLLKRLASAWKFLIPSTNKWPMLYLNILGMKITVTFISEMCCFLTILRVTAVYILHHTWSH